MRKKLIEVALPLASINEQSAYEKTVKVGKPTSMHLWWARRPIVACRAVLFASLIDDPGQDGLPPELLDRIDRLPLPEQSNRRLPIEHIGDERRDRLFAFIEKLVRWDNSNDAEVLTTARDLIRAATGGRPPTVLDPFCGGGSIPLEAQRLGLEAHASDLNPVAVLITKAMIEIPPKFAGRPPVNSTDQAHELGAAWKGASGLAADVRHYGQWIRDRAEQQIGHLYPPVSLPKEYGGGQARVIAWLWARTVECPNPACGAAMPLVSSFVLSNKERRKTQLAPHVDRESKAVTFTIHGGDGPPPPAGTVSRTGATCLVCGTFAPLDYVAAEGNRGRLGFQLLASVAEGRRQRVYLPATPENHPAATATPADVPDTRLPEQALGFRVQRYGLREHRHLFTPRQLVALTTFTALMDDAREHIRAEAVQAGMDPDEQRLQNGGMGADAYADAVITYLAFALSRSADWGSTLGRWENKAEVPQQVFGRQTVS